MNDWVAIAEEGRRLLAAATEKHGPWVAEERGGYAKVRRGDGSLIIVGDALYHPQNVADAYLIVAAVNQYEALLDVVDAARAVLDHPAGLGLAALLAYDRESSNRLRAALAAIPPSRDSTPDPLE